MGGYSRQFLRTFIDGDVSTISDSGIDAAIQWIDVEKNQNKWVVPIQSAAIVIDDNEYGFKVTSNRVEFDTGATFSVVPMEDYMLLLQAARENVSTGSCESKPDLLNGGNAVFCRCVPANVDTDPWPVLSMEIGL